MTLPVTAAGVVAKLLLKSRYPAISITANLLEAGGLKRYKTIVYEISKMGDSIGGLIECRANGIPVGLGEPFFDSIESYISHLAFSIPGIKGIEFGKGFAAAKVRGSVYNDRYIDSMGRTATNHAGGINGGITNGNELIFRVAAKPASSISKPQETFDFAANKIKPLVIKGRHDTCFALRLPVVIEAVTAIALADFDLMN
jgi:chorismate synthase